MAPCSKLLVLLGPTGVGKTELSLRLAEHYRCPIINADSRQIYRDLPIGTAAPVAADLARVRHFIVGTHALEETYNAGQFARDVEQIIAQLQAGESVPPGRPIAILSGGSMLYIDAVCKGLDDIPEVPTAIREQVQQNYRTHGLTWLQAEVERLDPVYWTQVDRSNPARLSHCLELCLTTGAPYSCLRVSGRSTSSILSALQPVKIGLSRPREQLYDRINLRVEQMMEMGLEQEARQAYGRLAAPTVGYRELFDYFEGKTSREEAIRLIQQNSRHYAKRQLTWWRRDPDIHWLDATLDYETLQNTIDSLVGAGSLYQE